MIDDSGALGLIPAGAGNMNEHLLPTIRSRAHPRGCGEHFKIDVIPGFHPGSSPRVRGTLKAERDELKAKGLIPAGAGNIAGCT